jgi:YHS domain-containing protein
MVFKLIIGIVVLYLLYKLIRRGSKPAGSSTPAARGPAPEGGEELVEDPQCHAYVPVSQALCEEIAGRKVHFCSRACLEAYRKTR